MCDATFPTMTINDGHEYPCTIIGDHGDVPHEHRSARADIVWTATGGSVSILTMSVR